MQESSLGRDVFGFLLGGSVGAFAVGGVFWLLYTPLELNSPRDHTGAAVLLLMIATFLSGGWVTVVGINADFLSEFWLPMLVPLSAFAFLGFVAKWDGSELGVVLALAATGIGASAVFSLFLRYCIPPKEDAEYQAEEVSGVD